MYSKFSKIITNNKKVYEGIKVLLIGFLIAYPLLSSFYGIDLGDTGYHLYLYDQIFKNPENISFTAYFTTVVGAIWMEFFGGMGLWGFNLLELIIEWGAVFVVYKTIKKYLGDLVTLCGLCIGIICTGTYLNIFNYHQFHVTLLTIALCFQFKAIASNKLKYSLCSGIFMAIDIFSRVGSITILCIYIVNIFWLASGRSNIKDSIKHILVSVAGLIGTAVGFIILLMTTNQFTYFFENILRLFNLATTSDTGYSTSSLWDKLIFDSLDTIATGFIIVGSMVVLCISINMIYNKAETNSKRIIAFIVGTLGCYVAIYMIKYSFDVNPAEGWPQMTTGPRVVWGVFLTMSFFVFVIHLYNEKTEIAALVLQGCLLILLTIAGSNTGTKHVVLALWILAPVVCYAWCKLISWLWLSDIIERINNRIKNHEIKIKRIPMAISFAVVSIFFLSKIAHMAYFTVNFDSIDRSLVTESVDSEKLKYLKTTEREANSLNSVIKANLSIDEEKPIMVYGSSLLFYYLLDRESYVDMWITSSTYETSEFESDLNDSEKELPVVIYCRTSHAYGFDELNYYSLIESEIASSHDGKKEVLAEFLETNNYKVVLEDPYYFVLVPQHIDKRVDTSYMQYITNVEK